MEAKYSMDVKLLNSALSKTMLVKNGLSPDDANYFYQGLNEKPALKIIFNNLISGYYRLVLDAGCGIGLVEHNLPKSSEIFIIAMDLNRKYLGVAKSNSECEKVEYVLADARFLPFKDRVFDAIILHDILFGVELKTIFKQVYTNLKENGDLFFDLPNSFFYSALPFLLPFCGFNTYNLKETEMYLRNSGLKVTSRYVASFSTNTRIKLRLPEGFNSCLEKVFAMSPAKLHLAISNLWYLSIFICKKQNFS